MSIVNIDQIGTNQGNEVWSDLNVGDAGTPVYIENGIPKPCNIIEGEAGPDGDRGIQGIAGHQGLQGLQGKVGPAGAQGVQGKTGVQGAQGRVGSKGFVGVMGAQGAQGNPGKPGLVGAQGSRGCTGQRGSDGMVGLQGAQGRPGQPGHQGTLGAQGLEGIQGLQGIRGSVGARGTMGYQGEDGPVGIQGVTGEKGSVWVDGIRLDGYNTHLFEFDVERNKFMSKNDNKFNPADGKNYDEGILNGDLLYIRNGAVIAIWLDEAAYTSIKDSGAIIIDRLENGTYIETNYPVYYAGQTPLADVITPSNDLGTVVELMYRDGAWYYNGGLLTQTITEDITVTGVSLGQLREGVEIKAGTTIQELFTKLLVKEIDVHGVKPIISISVEDGNIKNGQFYEIGTELNGRFSISYTDGKFVGDTGYPYTLNAECPQGPTAYYQDNVLINDTVIGLTIMEEDITFNGVTSYGESEAVPRTNVGNLSEVKIASGSTNTGNIVVKGRYAMYYGTHPIATDSTIDDPDMYQFTEQSDLSVLEKVWLNPTSNTTIPIIESTDDNPSFVIVIPSTWDITETLNSLGQSVNVETTWYKQNTISYSNNGIDTEYQVYVSPSTEASSYKNIKLSK